VLGIIFGSLSGYFKGSWIDELIMRISDILLSFPALILALAFMGAFGVGDSEIFGLKISHTVKLLIVISITYAPIFARVMRSVVLQEVNEDYVAAAKVLGARDTRIIVREIMINTIPPMIVQATLMMAETVLISASLSFLGLGIQPPSPSLGVMLNEARDFMFQRSWWYAIVPGLFVSFSILGFNLLGDGLRDALDPHQSRKVKK
jgi:ABC-type dipeptide/oligopeptide/nickel transport system permease subunit